ncbi:MAG: hypothetical protein AB8H79_02120 [Myxococcota bacterium]
MLALLIALSSLAGGHYDPPEIAKNSALYAKAADRAGEQFRSRSSDVEVMAKALIDYREALDLLGNRAPAAERDRLEALQKQFNRDRAVLQAFANTMMDDFDTEFSAAMARHLPEGAAQCTPMLPTGPALPGIPSPMERNPECKGDALSAGIAASIDEDDTLKTAISEILALEWPTVRPAPEPQSPVGTSTRWVAVQPWFRSVAKPGLKRIDQADESGRLEFEAALENKTSPDAMKGMLADARELTRKTAAARARLASPVLAAVDGWNAKKGKKNLDVSWCANPEALGGCAGDDATRNIGSQLAADKKVLKAF